MSVLQSGLDEVSRSGTTDYADFTDFLRESPTTAPSRRYLKMSFMPVGLTYVKSHCFPVG